MQTSYEGVKECYYRVSAKALIRNSEGKILLAREDTGYWDIPGGGIDHGEQIHTALKREIMEEMGLETASISDQPIFVCLAESSGVASPKRTICLLIFEVSLKDYDFTPSTECEEIGFFSYSDLKNVNLYHPNHKLFEEMQSQGL